MTAPAKSLLVICPFPYGVAAAQRLKFEQYYEDWRSAGWQVDIAPFMDLKLWDVLYEKGQLRAKAVGVAKGYLRRIRDLLRVPRYDLVFCHMYVTPLGGSGFERVTRLLARRLIYDVEDNVISIVDRVDKQHPNPLLRFLRSAGKYTYLARRADHVIASSPALADHCRALNCRNKATYISSSIDAERFKPAYRYSNDGPVTIGWTGTFSSRPYLDLVAPVLQRLAKERPFKLRVIGNFDYELPGVDLEVVRWTARREIQDLQAFDIGLYPLPVDDWVSGKSGLKAIQYMMMALPCVATDVGTTPLIIQDGKNGLLVKTEDDWLAALRRLVDDPELRRRLGEQARADAVAKYSLDALATEYRNVLASVLEA